MNALVKYPRGVTKAKRKRPKRSSGDELLAAILRKSEADERAQAAEIDRIRKRIDPERAAVKPEHRFASSLQAYLDATGQALPMSPIADLAQPIHYLVIEGVRDGGPYYERVFRELRKTLDRLLASKEWRSAHMQEQLERAAALFHAHVGLRDEAVQRVVSALVFVESELVSPHEPERVVHVVRDMLEQLRPGRATRGRKALTIPSAVIKLLAVLGRNALPDAPKHGEQVQRASSAARRARKRANK